MLKEILAVSGKPGLFKLVSKSKNLSIIESLVDKKRIPVYTHDKLIAIGDSSVFTEEGNVSIRNVFSSIFEKEEGKNIPFDVLNAKPEELNAYFAEVLPAFDRKRVYPNDIKKMLKWYDLLIANGITDFSKKEEEETVTDEEKGELETTPPPASTKHVTSIQPSKVAKAKPMPKSTTPKRSVVGAKRGG